MRLVKLTKDHKHGDTQYYAGQTIELDAETADWLASVQIAEKVASREVIAEEPVKAKKPSKAE